MNALKLEKLKLQYEQDKLMYQQVNDLLKNPLIEFVLGMMFIAYVTRGVQSPLERLTGMDLAAGTMGWGLVGVISAQQLSAAIPYIGEMVPSLLPALKALK